MPLFKKTLIRLTVLNALLLTLLIAAFGTVIYFYEQKQTYRDSNRILESNVDQKIHLLQSIDTPLSDHPTLLFPNPDVDGPRHGPRDFLIWSVYDASGKRIASSLDESQYSSATIDKYFALFRTKQRGTIVEKYTDNYAYHVFSRNVTVDHEKLTVSSIVLVNTEKGLLQRLLFIIIDSTICGALLSVAVGFLLAKRALRPIQAAWDKQSRFVADASHELRTPLSILQLKIEGLLRRPKERIQETGEDIAVMLEETRRLSKLIGHLLTLARSDADRLEVVSAPVDLGQLIHKVTEPFAEMAEFNDKQFAVELTADPLIISGDAQRLHQLLIILLDNAMKFTPRGGIIRVTCRREPKGACLSVANTGSLIAEKDLPHLFERFYQADRARSDHHGTGLGLSIAEWIVVKHRGKIDVSSRRDSGTVFTVRFPLAKNDGQQLVAGMNKKGEKKK
ncbi:MAG: ATP-binding protein [Sporolactobacillus sp.]